MGTYETSKTETMRFGFDVVLYSIKLLRNLTNLVVFGVWASLKARFLLYVLDFFF